LRHKIVYDKIFVSIPLYIAIVTYSGFLLVQFEMFLGVLYMLGEIQRGNVPLTHWYRPPCCVEFLRWRVVSLTVKKQVRTRGRGCAVFKCTTIIIHADAALLVATGSSQQPAACTSASCFLIYQPVSPCIRDGELFQK